MNFIRITLILDLIAICFVSYMYYTTKKTYERRITELEVINEELMQYKSYVDEYCEPINVIKVIK